MLDDHLKGGKYDSPSEELRKETNSVSTTNTLAERNFGMLDRLIREKPNANMITYESIIMNRTNKTSQWRDKLKQEKKAKIMKWARKSVKDQYDSFKRRRALVQKIKNEKRLDKLEAKKRKEAKSLSMKESLCASISKYGGLWLEESLVDIKLAELPSDSAKKEALKCQIQFRQKVLPSLPGVDRKLFYLSEKGKLRNVDQLTNNLKELIRQLKKDKSVLKSSVSGGLPSVLPERTILEEKKV